MDASSSKKYTCSFEYTISVISGKWKSMILWHLQFGTMRYSQLQRQLKRVTQKMLTQSLRELEQDGLIVRTVYPVIPPKVEYSLSEEGKALIPIFELLHQWGRRVGSEKDVFIEH